MPSLSGITPGRSECWKSVPDPLQTGFFGGRVEIVTFPRGVVIYYDGLHLFELLVRQAPECSLLDSMLGHEVLPSILVTRLDARARIGRSPERRRELEIILFHDPNLTHSV